MNEQAFATETAATKIIHCPKCGAALTGETKFCPHCGEGIVPVPTVCRGCGATLPDNVSFCPACGTKRSENPSPAAAVAARETAPKKPDKKKIIVISVCAAVALIAILAIIVAVVMATRPIPVEKISLSDTQVELTEGETATISCTVYPSDAEDKTVVWTSSDTKIATVNSYGKITAVSKGECTITATCGEISKTVEITVKKKLPNLRSIYNQYCSSTWATIGSDNSYISVDTNPYNYSGGDSHYFYVVNSAIENINSALGLPDSLYEDMNQTSWSMGKQKATYSSIGIEVTWTYHPDKGLEVTYKLIVD